MATSKMTVKLNHAGVRALLFDPGVIADLQDRGERIAAAAGPGMVVETWRGRTRPRVTVVTDTPEARAAEASGRALTRAIGAGQ